MIDGRAARQAFAQAGLETWAGCVEQQLHARLVDKAHGDMQRWSGAISQLPDLPCSELLLDRGLIRVGSKNNSSPEQRQLIYSLLQTLHPWRKGPYRIHGVFIDTEWRSDWKWDRVNPHVDSFSGQRVLDVGCGNGYHCWRIAAAGAELVVGIDPTQLFLAQFAAVRHFIQRHPDGERLARCVHLLPLGIEDVPPALRSFDTTLSMGVLYHRRSPMDHLLELKDTLRPGGQLILETLVIDGGEGQVLVPKGRYAKMRNVWFIPSVSTLEAWMRRVGYRDVRTVDVADTTIQEQRATDWMHFESLEDFLDPVDNTRTIEGYPAPKRAVLLARA